MIAYVTSIGEPTTDLCIWSLERNGFDTVLIEDKDTSLAEKLKFIYETVDEDFLRVDADIIVNRNMTPDNLNILKDSEIWWWQFTTFDWFKQDTNHAMAFIRKEALPALRSNISRFMDDIRPETEMSRIREFYEPRRFMTYDKDLMGLHGYGIRNMKPVMQLKAHRGQSYLYDFELAQRLYEL